MKKPFIELDDDELEITNRSSKEIAIFNSFNKKNIPSNSVYESELSHIKTIDGSDTIGKQERKKLILEGNYSIHQGIRTPSFFYNLLAVSPRTLKPVENFTVNREVDHLPKEIREEEEKKYRESLKLCVRIQCFPGSQLVEELVDQVHLFQEERNPEKIDNWFEKRFPDKNISFHSFETALSYINTYPICLMNQSQTNTFHFYAPNLNPSDPQAEGPPLYLGSLEIRSSEDLSLLDPNERYQSVFTFASGEKVPLQYEKGSFFSKEEPDIFLQSTFSLKRFLTNKKEDKTIVPILVGKIKNKKVLGVAEETSAKPSTFEADASTLFEEFSIKPFASPQEWPFWVLGFSFLLLIGCTLFALTSSLYFTLKWIFTKSISFYRYLIGPKRPKPPGPNDEEINEMELEIRIDEQMAEDYKRIQESRRRLGISEDPPASFQEIKQEMYRLRNSTLNQYRLEIEEREKISFEENTLETTKRILKIAGSDPEIEEIDSAVKGFYQDFQDELRKWENYVERIPKGALEKITESAAQLNRGLRSIKEWMNSWQTKKAAELGEERQEAVRRSQAAHEEVIKDMDFLREELERRRSGEEAEDEDIDDGDVLPVD